MIEIGREYSVLEIYNICIKEELFDVTWVINRHPPDKPFKTDGCSCCPEEHKGVSITPYCIAHDLRYWCGLPGDKESRLKADIRLMELVAKATGDYDFARGIFAAVSAGGREGMGLPWEWGYGRSK